MSLATSPLADVVVIEAGTYITAPFAGQTLAQLGARVIKVEPPRGDPFRRFSHRYRDLSAAWVNVNQGKESVAIDLTTPGGQRRMHDLLATADVFLQNWRPGVASALGLDPDDAVERYERLVYLSISGFGEGGPGAGAPVFDTILQAASGLVMLESRGELPTALRSFVADKTTALYAVQAILAALHQRQHTGRGARIDLAMLDVMAHFNFPDLFQERTFLDEEQIDVPAPPPSAILETTDGYVCIAPVQGRHLAALANCLGHPDWIPIFKSIPTPRELMSTVIEKVATETRRRTTQQCVDLFAAADVPVIAVRTPDEHLSDPQTLHNRLYDQGPSPAGPVRRVRHPLVIDGQRLPMVGPAPQFPTPEPDRTSDGRAPRLDGLATEGRRQLRD